MGNSTSRAGDAEGSRRAALRLGAHPLRGNGRAYLGRAVGREWGAGWVVQGLRLLVFVAAGLSVGALFLLGAE